MILPSQLPAATAADARAGNPVHRAPHPRATAPVQAAPTGPINPPPIADSAQAAAFIGKLKLAMADTPHLAMAAQASAPVQKSRQWLG